MKISNETKIGALTAIAVTFLILGFNFLKGKTFFKTGNFLYAKFSDIKKLAPSNVVYINGFQVGTVYETNALEKDVKTVVVSIKLNTDYSIPDNSIAIVEGSPLGSSDVNIKLGTSTKYLQSGDTLLTENTADMLGEISGKIAPVADQLKATLHSLDSVLKNVNTIFDPNTKANMQTIIANLSKATGSIVVSTASLQTLLNSESSSLAKSLTHVDSFTANLAANNDKITHIMSNLDKTTENLSKADIDGVVANLKTSVEHLNDILAKMKSSDGTLGALVNDKELYNKINNTVTSLNTLMDDLRVHPKRYVNISVFGKKDKGDYLTAPLKDSTHTPQK